MVKIILAVIVALFAALFLIGIGAGIQATLDCSSQWATGSSEWESCMDTKTTQLKAVEADY